MSQLSVNAITDAAGGNTATINGTTPTAQSLQGFRNRIINGDMRIDQRNNGASVTPVVGTTSFPVDRWLCAISASSKFSAQRNAGSVTPPAGFSNYLGATSLSAYSVAAGDYFAFQQNIEGFNAADLAWGTASAATTTLSFWVRCSLTGTFGGVLKNGVANRSYPFTYTISAANTWEYKTVTVAGDTSGTWASDNTAGICVVFSLGAGSTFSGTAGSWSGANLISATGATSVVGTNGATFQITGVQLEAGSVATPFERRPYGQELALCQRYYELGSFQTNAYVTGGGNLAGTMGFSATKRSTPTITATKTSGLNTGGTINSAAYLNGVLLYAAFAGTGEGYFAAKWTASAEL